MTAATDASPEPTAPSCVARSLNIPNNPPKPLSFPDQMNLMASPAPLAVSLILPIEFVRSPRNVPMRMVTRASPIDLMASMTNCLLFLTKSNTCLTSPVKPGIYSSIIAPTFVRMSRITGFRFSPNCFVASMSCWNACCALPPPPSAVKKFCAALFIWLNEPSTVPPPSLAVVPAIFMFSWVTWIASMILSKLTSLMFLAVALKPLPMTPESLTSRAISSAVPP